MKKPKKATTGERVKKTQANQPITLAEAVMLHADALEKHAEAQVKVAELNAAANRGLLEQVVSAIKSLPLPGSLGGFTPPPASEPAAAQPDVTLCACGHDLAAHETLADERLHCNDCSCADFHPEPVIQ